MWGASATYFVLCVGEGAHSQGKEGSSLAWKVKVLPFLKEVCEASGCRQLLGEALLLYTRNAKLMRPERENKQEGS